MSSSADRAERAERTGGHESAALDEIELAGELMIAATASTADRLPTARIDEVLLHQQADPAPAGPAPAAGDRVAGDQAVRDQAAGDQAVRDQAAGDQAVDDRTAAGDDGGPVSSAAAG